MASRLVEEINAELLAEQASSDGAIEPLEIRRIVALREQLKKAAHKPAGATEEGNVSETGGADSLVSVVKISDKELGVSPFVDEANSMGGLRVSTEELSPDNRKNRFFDDQKEVKGVIVSDAMESDVLEAVRAMSPGTENHVADEYMQLGATGFTPYVSKLSPETVYNPPPVRPVLVINSISQQYAFPEGGDVIYLTGENFANGCVVYVGPNAASTTFIDSNNVSFVLPAYAGLIGTVPVVARNPDGMAAETYLTYLLNDLTNGLRLSLSYDPDSFSTSTSTMLYLVPSVHGRIALWNGSAWVLRQVQYGNPVSMSLGTVVSGTNYDVFAYDDTGEVKLELSSPWADNVTRTDALTTTWGVPTKSGDETRRHVGTIRTISTTQTVDTTSQRFVWNRYNQKELYFSVQSPSASVGFGNPSSAWRAYLNLPLSGVFEYVCGDTSFLNVRAMGHATLNVVGGTGAPVFASVGIGINTTSANSALVYGSNPNTTTLHMTALAEYRGYPTGSGGATAGYFQVFMLQTANSANTLTTVGKYVERPGVGSGYSSAQPGMFGAVRG